MFPIRHSLFIPPTRAWHIRQVGVDWPARRHYYLLDTHAWSPIVLAKPRLVLVFAGLICFTLASTPHGASAATAEVAKKCSALTAKVFPPRVIGNPGAGSAKETASLSRPISRNAWRAAAKSRTTAPTTKKADVLSGPTGSGGGARPPRRRRGRCLAFHKVAKEARQLGPILKRRVRGILET